MWTKIIEWLNVRDNVTFLIAVASFGLSIWNFVSDKLENRKKLDVTVRDVFCLGPSREKEYTEVLNLMVVNKSREAITLSGLAIETENQTYQFGEHRLKLLTHSHKIGNKEVSRSEWYSDVFPIKIEGLGCAHMLLSSTGAEKHIQADKPYRITISSNKGIVEKTVTSDFSSAAQLLQCRAPDLQVEALV